jgi:hypothetical protein
MRYMGSLLAVALSFAPTACHSEEKSPMTNSTPRPENQPAALSQELGVPIPGDAKVLGVKRESGIDEYVRIKLLVPHASRDQFTAGLPIRPEAFHPGVGRLGSDDGFWNPHATPQIKSASKALPDGRYLLVGIAEQADGTVIFIAKHGT